MSINQKNPSLRIGNGKIVEELKQRLAATPYSQFDLLAVLRENQVIPREGGTESLDELDNKHLQLVLDNWEDVVDAMHLVAESPALTGSFSQNDPPNVKTSKWLPPAVAKIVQKEPPTARHSKRVLTGYEEAEEFTGIPVSRLKRMVARRSIRVIKESPNTVFFLADHLMKDLEDLEQAKFE